MIKLHSSIKSLPLVILFLTILFTGNLSAQETNHSELYNLLKEKDSLLFEIGFNQCDLNQMEKLLPVNFEFYHDKDGIITTRSQFLNTIKENICNSSANIKRKLKPESLEVFPLYKNDQLYGAVQNGVHYFGTVSSKFTHLWLKEEGEWYPKRMISYDHKIEEIQVVFITLSANELIPYLGKYEFSPDFLLNMVLEGNKIYGDAQGQKVEIKPYGNHRFLDESKTMNLQFIVNEEGSVTGLNMEGSNGSLSAKKIN